MSNIITPDFSARRGGVTPPPWDEEVTLEDFAATASARCVVLTAQVIALRKDNRALCAQLAREKERADRRSRPRAGWILFVAIVNVAVIAILSLTSL